LQLAARDAVSENEPIPKVNAMAIPKHPAGERPEKSGHLTVRPEDLGPTEVRFMFENQEKRTWGAGTASVAAHLAFIAIVILISQLVPERVYQTVLPERLSEDIVWLVEPGPGGGGGGGNKSPEPPKQAELPGKEKISVPAVKPPDPEPTPEPPKEEPPPLVELNIPAQQMAAATTVAPGALDPTPTPGTDSRGSGTGTGAGPGQGSGLGPGSGGGTGGGVYDLGSGVEPPRILQKVDPRYTAEAMRAKVQGTVIVQAVVLPDGSVTDVEVIKSLDPTFGLDQEAVRAARQWRFHPGTRFGEPVSVRISIELAFTLR
jgi:protein TonB